jgi:hypothetical protein
MEIPDFLVARQLPQVHGLHDSRNTTMHMEFLVNRGTPRRLEWGVRTLVEGRFWRRILRNARTWEGKTGRIIC